MKFTDEQRKIIDRLLQESDEMQKLPGSRYYTTEEIRMQLRELYNRDVQNSLQNKCAN